MYSNRVHNISVVSSSWLASNINANAKRNFQTKYSNPKTSLSGDYHFRDGDKRLEELKIGKSNHSLGKKPQDDGGDSDLDENDPLTIQIKQIIMEELSKPKSKISQLNLGITGLQYVFDSKQPWGCKIFWLTIIVACISVCSYQMVDRVSLFLRYPVAAEIGVVQNQTVQFPVMVACPVETRALALVNKAYKEKYPEMAEKTKKDCEDLQLAHLVGFEYEGKKLSAEDVWNLTDPYIQNYFQVHTFQDLLLEQEDAYISDELVSMFNGKCIKFTLNRYVDFHGIATQINLISKVVDEEDGKCNRYGYKLLVMDTYDPPDMKQLVPVTSGAKVGFTVLVKQYEALDAPNNPCVSSQAYRNCHEDCTQGILDNKIKCKLPYMKKSSKKNMCDNAKDALETQNEAENTLLDLNVTKECQCVRKCIRVMYSMLPKSYKFNSPDTDVAVYYASNYFEIVKESYAYDWMSLLCDIGGNLGLYLGLSVLSVFEIVQSFFETYKREAAQNLARQNQQQQLERGEGPDKRKFNDRISTSYGHYGNINQGFNDPQMAPRTNVW